MDKLFWSIGILFAIIAIFYIIPIWKYCKKYENQPQKIVDERVKKKLAVVIICMILAFLFNITGIILSILK